MERASRSLVAAVLLCLAAAGCWQPFCSEFPEQCVKDRMLIVDPPFLRKGVDNTLSLQVKVPLMPSADGAGKVGKLGMGTSQEIAVVQKKESLYEAVVRPRDQPAQAFGQVDLQLYVMSLVFGSAKTAIAVEPALKQKPPLALRSSDEFVQTALSATAAGKHLFLELQHSTGVGMVERRLQQFDFAAPRWQALPEKSVLSAGQLGGAFQSTGSSLTVKLCGAAKGLQLSLCSPNCVDAQCTVSTGFDRLDAFAVNPTASHLFVAGTGAGQQQLRLYTIATSPKPSLTPKSPASLVLVKAARAIVATSNSSPHDLVVLYGDGALQTVSVDVSDNLQIVAGNLLGDILAARKRRPAGEDDRVTAIAVGSTGGDGREDLAVAIGKSIYILHDWRLGVGMAQVAGPYVLDSAAAPAALALVDVDSDGFADLAVATQPPSADAPSDLYLLRNYAFCAQDSGCRD